MHGGGGRGRRHQAARATSGRGWWVPLSSSASTGLFSRLSSRLLHKCVLLLFFCGSDARTFVRVGTSSAHFAFAPWEGHCGRQPRYRRTVFWRLMEWGRWLRGCRAGNGGGGYSLSAHQLGPVRCMADAVDGARASDLLRETAATRYDGRATSFNCFSSRWRGVSFFFLSFSFLKTKTKTKKQKMQ